VVDVPFAAPIVAGITSTRVLKLSAQFNRSRPLGGIKKRAMLHRSFGGHELILGDKELEKDQAAAYK
jgi:hypothetical protein